MSNTTPAEAQTVERLAQASVDRAIIETVLPDLYHVVNELLGHAPTAPKELVTQARRLLPGGYTRSFQFKG